jgi:hypothetical protein
LTLHFGNRSGHGNVRFEKSNRDLTDDAQLTLAEDRGVGRGMGLFNFTASYPADSSNVDEVGILGEKICESVHVMPIPSIDYVPNDRLDGILRGRVRGRRRGALGKSQRHESSNKVFG